MSAARTITTTAFITQIRQDLRDINSAQYTDAELLSHINKCYEYLYLLLVQYRSELVRTGVGSFNTVAGTQSYDLAANSMGDFWLIDKVWISTYELMCEVPDTELYDAINEEERGDTGHRTRPEEYCIIGDYIWFKDVPDDTYQVNVRYFPNFIPLTAGDNLPFRNLFNQEIAQGVLVCAKNRNELPVQIDVILKDIFFDKAMSIAFKRRKTTLQFVPAQGFGRKVR